MITSTRSRYCRVTERFGQAVDARAGVRHGYGPEPIFLSGKWAEDGNSHVNTAKLWANYSSPDLQNKLTQA